MHPNTSILSKNTIRIYTESYMWLFRPYEPIYGHFHVAYGFVHIHIDHMDLSIAIWYMDKAVWKLPYSFLCSAHIASHKFSHIDSYENSHIKSYGSGHSNSYGPMRMHWSFKRCPEGYSGTNPRNRLHCRIPSCFNNADVGVKDAPMKPLNWN